MRAEIHKPHTLKIFEREVKFFGVEFSEFKYLVIEAFAMVLIPSITDLAGMEAGLWFYLFMIMLMLATIVLLRSMAKHRYKNYLADFISFKVKQPRLIRVRKKNG